MAQYKYEFIDTNSNKSIGKVWWDEKRQKVKADNQAALRLFLTGHSVVTNDGNYPEDKYVIENLPKIFKSSYVSLKKVK